VIRHAAQLPDSHVGETEIAVVRVSRWNRHTTQADLFPVIAKHIPATPFGY